MLVRYNRKAVYLICCLSLLAIYVLVYNRRNNVVFESDTKIDDSHIHQQHYPEPEKSPGYFVNVLKSNDKSIVEVKSDEHYANPFNKIYNFKITDKKAVPQCQHKGSLASVISAPEEQFQPVEHNSKLAYVYSAHYDTDGRSNEIRVFLAVQGGGNSGSFYCQLWYRQDDRVMYASPGMVTNIPEGGGALYQSAYMTCSNPSPEIPYAVSVSKEPCDEPANVLRVIPKPHTPPLSSGERKFAACVTPLNLQYDKMHQLVEYIEFSKLMGVSHFYFYNYSSSQRTADILNKYGPDLISIVQWHLPMKVHVWPVPPKYREEIKYFGQMLMLNECIMRSRAYQYVAFADLDELLVPRSHKNWYQLFSKINPNGDPHTVGWSFRNTFFKTEFESDPRAVSNHTIARLGAMSLLKTKREHAIFPSGSRSKLIVRPQFINTMGVHNVWRVKLGSVTTVPIDLGLCHHYRFWEGMGTKVYMVDDNVWRMKEQLVDGFTKAYQMLDINPEVPGN